VAFPSKSNCKVIADLRKSSFSKAIHEVVYAFLKRI